MSRNVLTEKLATLRGTLRRTLAIAGLAIPAAAALIWFAVSFGGDWLLEPSRAWRAAFLIAGAVGVVFLAFRAVVRPYLRRFSDDDMAMVVERHWPDLENRVISAVQFARMGDPEQYNMSRAMVAQVAGDAQGQTANLDFSQAVERTRAWRGPGFIALAVAVPLILAFAAPAQFETWARRSVLLEDIRRPRESDLALIDPPGNIVKKRRGDSLTLVVESREGSVVPKLIEVYGTGGGDPEKETGSGFSLFGGGKRLLGRLDQRGDRVFEGEVLKDLRSDATLTIRGGDAELGPVEVLVVDAVECSDMTLECRYPDYIATAPAIRHWGGKWGSRVELPVGTRVRLTGTATKPLSAAEIRLPRGLGDAVDFGDPPRAKGESERLIRRLPESAMADKQFEVSFTVVQSVSLDFVLTDTDGLSNFTATRPIRLDIQAKADAAPTATLRLAGIGDMITPAARVPMHISVRDDHGIRSARVVAMQAPDAETRLRNPNAKPTELSPALPLASRAAPFGPNAGDIRFNEVVWEVGDLRLTPGNRIELDVRAEDFRPVGRDAAGQATYQVGGVDERYRKSLQVVTPDVLLLRLLEEQIKRRNELDQKIRTQLELVAELERGIEADKAPAVSEDAYGIVRKVAQAQGRLAEELVHMTGTFRDLLAEMDNNRVWTEGDDRRIRLQSVITEMEALLEERLNRLRPTETFQQVITMMPDPETFLSYFDLDGDGQVDAIEWSQAPRLLATLDPNADFPAGDLAPGLKSLAELYRLLGRGKPLMTREDVIAGQASLKLRQVYLWTAGAVQRDALERMRRIRSMLPRDSKFAAVLEGINQLINRQQDAKNATKKAGDRAAEDVFDDPKK